LLPARVGGSRICANSATLQMYPCELLARSLLIASPCNPQSGTSRSTILIYTVDDRIVISLEFLSQRHDQKKRDSIPTVPVFQRISKNTKEHIKRRLISHADSIKIHVLQVHLGTFLRLLQSQEFTAAVLFITSRYPTRFKLRLFEHSLGEIARSIECTNFRSNRERGVQWECYFSSRTGQLVYRVHGVRARV